MKQTSTRANQQGFVSIVIALTIVIVLALITVAFAQLTRREQQNALDKQLASQANYAAESGINDAIQDLDSTNSQILSNGGKPNCQSNLASGNSSTLNQTNGVSYSCLLVNVKPTSLLYSNVDSLSDRTALFSTSAAADSFTFSWASSDGRGPTNTAITIPGQFQDMNSWNAMGVVQVMIVPYGANSGPYTSTRAALRANAKTFYLYPSTTGSNSIAYSAAQGSVVSGLCTGSGSYPCSVTVTGIPSAPKYLVHFIPYYDTTNLQITGAGGGNAVQFLGGQAVIDSTGKARDVLKRLVVRVPLSNGAEGIRYALEADAACKQFTADPLNGVVDDTDNCPNP